MLRCLIMAFSVCKRAPHLAFAGMGGSGAIGFYYAVFVYSSVIIF